MYRNAHQIIGNVKLAIRHPYAWPGGYPIYTVMADGGLLCPCCAKTEFRQIVRATYQQSFSDWRAIGTEILWEGLETVCAHCGKYLQSAYGE